MKLEEVAKPQYKIYCDLDGVVVNFAKKAKELFGFEPRGQHKLRDKAAEAMFWAKVTAIYAAGGHFWRDMEPMSDMQQLWSYINPHNPTILTSRGKIPAGAKEKVEWVAQHLQLPPQRIIVVDSGSKKAEYATSTSILIDDTVYIIDKWVKAGGIGILHVSAADTISKLKDLGV